MNNFKIKFYKYCRDYTYLNDYCEHIWLSPIRELNDPFENQYSIKHPHPTTILNDPNLFNFYHDYVMTYSPDSEDDFKSYLKSDRAVHEMKLNKFQDDQFTNFGVLSVTTDPFNIPMWAYYANNHEGYCIEYELDFSIIQNMINHPSSIINQYINELMSGEDILYFGKGELRFALLKIIYTDTVPSLDTQIVSSFAHPYDGFKFLLRRVAGTKLNGWSHENEFRLLSNLNSKEWGLVRTELNIPFLKIKGVILGNKTSPSNVILARSLSNKYQLNLFQTELAQGTYDMSMTTVDR